MLGSQKHRLPPRRLYPQVITCDKWDMCCSCPRSQVGGARILELASPVISVPFLIVQTGKLRPRASGHWPRVTQPVRAELELELRTFDSQS